MIVSYMTLLVAIFPRLLMDNVRSENVHLDAADRSDVDLFHIIWACLAAALLRGIFSQPSKKAGPHGDDLTRSFFQLTLPNSPREALTGMEKVSGE
ncbi:hypothetical protein PC119_g25229 [Phytophthora cactorum]|uniref:Uncharacterized protein n=1 Tax=Phytophthora cactorum TaxID=29920 RepID=A0A8T1AFF9_9STRA|nr:hypothetical protein PC111_g21471 [Phytophthora cactorum]KAG2797014.1 hypothetical protein PC112_g21969 [Phytophthora cactorum]KAG2826148.1 hypothetical protein PC113_g21818 [Phytophthora cactorum]KAG2873866.1 hypothetical protein PC114_g25615 [Phytophthora cactorum]KAG2879545.1 hypothetical protein PC115_g22766 [Phytophthora cactorum]